MWQSHSLIEACVCVFVNVFVNVEQSVGVYKKWTHYCMYGKQTVQTQLDRISRNKIGYQWVASMRSLLTITGPCVWIIMTLSSWCRHDPSGLIQFRAKWIDVWDQCGSNPDQVRTGLYRPSAIGVAVMWAGFLSDVLVYITHVQMAIMHLLAVEIAIISSTKTGGSHSHKRWTFRLTIRVTIGDRPNLASDRVTTLKKWSWPRDLLRTIYRVSRWLTSLRDLWPSVNVFVSA